MTIRRFAFAAMLALAACSPSNSPAPSTDEASYLKTAPRGYSDSTSVDRRTTIYSSARERDALKDGVMDRAEFRCEAPADEPTLADTSPARRAKASETINGPNEAPLRASEVDDNETFDQYLAYHHKNATLIPEAYRLDVSERYVFEVLDQKERFLPNARIRVTGNDKLLMEGCTDSRGRVGFHPRTTADSNNVKSFTATVRYGDATKVVEVERKSGGLDKPIQVRLATAKKIDAVRLELLFLLDTTGSMGDEIARIQSTLLTITDRISKLESKPQIRLGMVLYRDQGDEYVTRRFGFTQDVDAFNKALREVKAYGGGDDPESMNMGLLSAVDQIEWSVDSLRLIFLVADAPPHMDYPQDVPYPTTLKSAVAKGIKIYPTGASGLSATGSYAMRQIAQFTGGQFLFIEYGQSAGGHGVEEGTYRTNNLDEIVLRIVKQELAAFAS